MFLALTFKGFPRRPMLLDRQDLRLPEFLQVLE